ncbi:MBL fold metallo-hydrolase [Arthrobacter sp. HS15c]|uniref:MBL fold metallo-hydrolase n=1 Tax=Arthrobacter sp. HS15c TaxID=3230279 RepID=UPI0034656867
MNTTPDAAEVPIRVLNGPTVLIEYAGLRFLTDPTFDDPGEYPTPIPGFSLVKTAPSPVIPAKLGHIDAVLLSHDEHDDNLDHSGREFIGHVPLTLTTVSGAGRLGGTSRGLGFWDEVHLTAPDGTDVTITGLPALHGPEGSESVSGDVIGFLLTAAGHPSVYISGDNASMECIEQIAERHGPVDIAVLFIGGVRHKPFFNGALVTIDNPMAAKAARVLEARRVVPAHFEGWSHFSGGRKELVDAFSTAGLADRLSLD